MGSLMIKPNVKKPDFNVNNYGFTTGWFPHGPQTNVPLANITDLGWDLCYSGSYSSAITASDANRFKDSLCTKANIMLGCRDSGTPSTVIALAWASRTCVFADTGYDDKYTTTSCEGTEWYFNDRWSMGFARQGDSVFKNSCDYEPSGCNDCRMCWHTSRWHGGGRGYRCGSAGTSTSNKEYLIFHTGNDVNLRFL